MPLVLPRPSILNSGTCIFVSVPQRAIGRRERRTACAKTGIVGASEVGTRWDGPRGRPSGSYLSNIATVCEGWDNWKFVPKHGILDRLQ